MKRNPVLVGLLQSLGLVAYCSLVGLIIWNVGNFLGTKIGSEGPILLLSLFVVSAIICALIALGYPFIVFWDRKNTKEALKMVGFTAAWLALFVLAFLIALIIF
ncbi:hypothetical protein A3E46_00600 [Candidatus Woesebacteria bacterium RIFCSPHIGHO2_12_FULL_46_16]|uniref:Uncharacterized protein n=1 Tax=Candidatus Woesebacteria bacterium RIFCSPHIGHO2_12_FULL_46_16 TaxID=1802513 RepID=A0A1F8B0F5_9BACT|nr:MAG: hypothetical protein A3E46_00600 [Candidatus Woesebacteria bacterium RIFCSPHIGHO2_12_FULL_46_16]